MIKLKQLCEGVTIIDNNNLGININKYRQKLGFSIRELAEQINISSSMLSQIEKGTANPSLNTLRGIAAALDIPVFSLFIEEDESDTIVVRKEDRLQIKHGIAMDERIHYNLLVPDLKGDIEFCELVLSSKLYSLDELKSHKGEEVALCTKGRIELHLENKIIRLNEGDSVRIPKNTLHRWKNPNEEECKLVFAITPPSF
ncbi:helix-turn-helix domain-containing protein [Anaerosphaera multitolerans]|uniref:Helix-turn-helix domain-containing protein n=1 Tax=Anaerosphaera multitolerans TaxID=2487351 RepID=A0A437S659_9FIRM|nr:helix-turn-helix domain-containing protein [Anaerosphaera multitolerans]RVU54532.1 helix-turn-helix domain-containing protein [Anaerosphaera multitolerans]